MAKKITHEILCASLLTHSSIQETAADLNISERTIYNMMRDKEFIELYDHAQADILNNTLQACQRNMLDAINCIADIMNDKKINAQTRLLAAKTILDKCMPLYDMTNNVRQKAFDDTKTERERLLDDLALI